MQEKCVSAPALGYSGFDGRSVNPQRGELPTGERCAGEPMAFLSFPG